MWSSNDINMSSLSTSEVGDSTCLSGQCNDHIEEIAQGDTSRIEQTDGSCSSSHIVQKVHSPNLLKQKCISEVVRIGSIIIFHLSKL